LFDFPPVLVELELNFGGDIFSPVFLLLLLVTTKSSLLNSLEFLLDPVGVPGFESVN
jgi:hypothetical protein